MISNVKKYIDQDDRYTALIKKVHKNPYIEAKDLLEDISEQDLTFYENAINHLTSEFILVELTSQAGSTVESRVPKKIFIINPEVTDELDKIFS
ncbi:hypothetical protein [Pseudogracilibacillus auburnensis]|uniref:hypothetical protein n=1 Tax=Pseudogracilibacillus auburnensis TaxID=1494959 RepID=UPI001A95B3AE|nr:hypothetical protein [Pseudogracilibacillus auburnensis]MBO1002425.1 hypothetical protein [Pseudogracilibacillus auburnensis]